MNGVYILLVVSYYEEDVPLTGELALYQYNKY